MRTTGYGSVPARKRGLGVVLGVVSDAGTSSLPSPRWISVVENPWLMAHVPCLASEMLDEGAADLMEAPVRKQQP